MPVHVAAYVVLVCSIGEFPMLKLFVPVGCTSVTCVVLVPTVISALYRFLHAATTLRATLKKDERVRCDRTCQMIGQSSFPSYRRL
jgi:hypothetical protein